MLTPNAENSIIVSCIIAFVVLLFSAVTMPEYVTTVALAMISLISFSSGVWVHSLYVERERRKTDSNAVV